MRASRLLSILILLQLRGRQAAVALADEFEVSVRTIYRDIDDLSAAGIPVYGDRGPGGGFQLLDGYRTQLTGLAPEEAGALFMMGLPDAAKALGIGPAATQATNKLMAALPAARGAEARHRAARIHVDMVDWYRAAEPVAHLPDLARAVFGHHLLTMTYESWTSTRAWQVKPLGLVLKGGSWYLIALGAGKIRMFRASNITGHRISDENFVPPADFDLARWWALALVRFEDELRPATATLRASSAALKQLAREGAYAAAAVAGAVADQGGSFRLSLPIEGIDQAARLLLGLGPEIEVIAPAELRDHVRKLALAIAGLYE